MKTVEVCTGILAFKELQKFQSIMLKHEEGLRSIAQWFKITGARIGDVYHYCLRESRLHETNPADVFESLTLDDKVRLLKGEALENEKS